MPNYYRNTIKRRSKRTKLLAIAICAMLLLSLAPFLDTSERDAGGHDDASAPEPAISEDLTVQDQADAGSPETDDGQADVGLKAGVVQKGDTIMTLLADFFSPAEIINLARQCEEVFSLSRICAGHAFAITTRGDDFHGFEYEINASERLKIVKEESGFNVAREPIVYDVSVARVTGSINSHLFAAVEQAGESPELAVRLADIFAWDIDFIRDVHEGDSFTVLVEKRSRDGESAGYGRILAAEFVSQGRAHRGFLFEAAEGQAHYYDEQGRSLRKAFLKAPLDFRRISSGFSRNRLHPVLGVSRPHLGIDYAAPTGTPIKSVGDGVIVKATRNNASGNYVSIRHNSTYETSYLHMSRFASGIKTGARVRQGQVIGYVGQTGWATGPHLCFRMKKNSQPINPATLKIIAGDGVPQARMEAFAQTVSRVRAELEDSGRYSAEAEREAGPAL